MRQLPRVSSMLFGAGLLALVGCGKSDKPSGTTFVPDPTVDTGIPVFPGKDSSAPSPEDTSPVITDSGVVVVDSSGVETSIFGPVPDAVFAEGPTFEMPEAGPLGCAKDVAKLRSTSLTASGVTPKAFADAWNAEAKKHPGGVILIELSGLSSKSPPKFTLKIGTPDGASPPNFFTMGVAGPGTANATIDSASKMIDARNEDSLFEVRFDATTLIPFGKLTFRGTLDAKCESVTGVVLWIAIPESAKSKAFGGSTLGALLGPTNDVIEAEGAWKIELTGTAVNAGGS